METIMPLVKIDNHPFSLLRQAFGLLDEPRVNSSQFQHCDFVEKDDHYLLSVDVPGFSKEDLDIEISDSQLKISGERKTLTNNGYGKFQRTVGLHSDIKKDGIAAHCENGVLTIALPKMEKPQTHKIPISTGKGEGLWSKLLEDTKATVAKDKS